MIDPQSKTQHPPWDFVDQIPERHFQCGNQRIPFKEFTILVSRKCLSEIGFDHYPMWVLWA